MYNLLAFWPELKISVTDPISGFNSDHFVSTSTSSSTFDDGGGSEEENIIKCSTRLFWPHRHRVHTLLREPHKFIPNMTAM